MRVENPNKLPTISVDDITVTQGNLKDLTEKNYNKLKNSIETKGFYVPVFIWKDKESGKNYLLDGTQRVTVVRNEGWKEEIPYISIPADNLQDAAERLLAITSQYGTITQEGVDEYISIFELNDEDVFAQTSFDKLPVFDVQPLTENGLGTRSLGQSLQNEELRDSMSVVLTFDKASFVEFMTYANYFRESYGADTVTDAITMAVKDRYEDSIRETE